MVRFCFAPCSEYATHIHSSTCCGYVSVCPSVCYSVACTKTVKPIIKQSTVDSSSLTTTRKRQFWELINLTTEAPFSWSWWSMAHVTVYEQRFDFAMNAERKFVAICHWLTSDGSRCISASRITASAAAAAAAADATATAGALRHGSRRRKCQQRRRLWRHACDHVLTQSADFGTTTGLDSITSAGGRILNKRNV